MRKFSFLCAGVLFPLSIQDREERKKFRLHKQLHRFPNADRIAKRAHFSVLLLIRSLFFYYSKLNAHDVQ
jgi:hypothetical protein